MYVEQTPLTGSEEKESLPRPVRALSDFYEAFNNRDMELMARNWAQTDEAEMDNPLGGLSRGWEEIQAVYERLFQSPAHVQVELYDYSVHKVGEVFYAVGRERGQFQADGRTLQLSIRTTRIFRIVDGQWRQVHHHGSIEDPQLLATYRQAVRGQ